MKKENGSPKQSHPWRWVFGILFFILILAPATYLLCLPNIAALKTRNPTETTLMVLRDQQARQAKHTPKRLYLWKNLDDISPHLAHAVLLSEDDTFYTHHGFDIEQIRIALDRDIAQRRFAYGGSTITQQLARSLYLSPRKNLFRKAKEALITILLERYLTKRRIMELYLNVVEWGPGLYGAEAAAQTYFQKPARELSPDEAVALASILPSPRRWSPLSERRFMARRRTQLALRMREAGFLPVEVSTEPVVPQDIQDLAAQANEFLQRQASEENALTPVPDDKETASPEEDDGLITAPHEPAPQ